jgi:uncharacterized protein HemX
MVNALKPRPKAPKNLANDLMDFGTYLLPALSAALAAALTFGACRVWHARRTRDLLGRVEKSERARQAAGQQAQQARKQIEQLQKELAAQHKARAEAVSARKRVEHLEQAAQEPPPRAAAAASLLAFDDASASLPAHGFADTMPLVDGPGQVR